MNASQVSLPIEKISQLRSQGMDNNSIMQNLKQQGFTSSQIFDAMNQLDMRGGQESDGEMEVPRPPSPPNEGSEVPVPAPSYTGQQSTDIQQNQSNEVSVSNEELIESIIDEKWEDLLSDVTKIIEWKNSANSKIVELEHKFDALKNDFDKIHSALLRKIDDYDKNITHVGAEVRAMEKVFSNVLPVFAENVSELSQIAKQLGSSKSSKKK